MRILEAPGSGKTSRAASAKSAGLALAPRIVCPPPPTPVTYAGHAACDAVDGSEASGLLEPRSTAYDTTVLLESESINRYFVWGGKWFLPRHLHALAGESFGSALRRRGLFGLVWRARICPRGTTRPSRSRYTRARSGLAGGSKKSGGKSLPAADLPDDAAGESASRVGSPAAAPKHTRVHAIRGIGRWGGRGA